MTPENFETFEAQKLSEGYDQALVRTWEPNFTNEPHTHPFDTEALVVQGQFTLTIDGQSHLYRAGDSFRVARGVVHAESYGPEGAIFWVARKN